MASAYEVLMPLAPWECPDIVRQALASIHAQTLPPRRLLISCDGEPGAELRRVLEPLNGGAHRVNQELLVGPGGEGVGPVLARGLLACETELVMRADADDISRPDRAERQVDVMVQRPDLAVLSGQIQEFVDQPDRPLRARTVPIGTHAIARYIVWRNPINHPAVMLRRSSVLAAGNYIGCPGFEDFYLWLRLHKQGAFLDNLGIPLVFARIGSAHLARRRGLSYARREAQFFMLCGRQGLLPWYRVAILMMVRCPLRLLPVSVLRKTFHLVLRSQV
jgi:hypothetical protein